MKIHFDREQKLQILLGMFIAAIIASNLLGTKISEFMGISFSVAIFMFPITFLITDIVEEAYGKEKAEAFIVAGFISLVMVLVFTFISVVLPPAARYGHNSEFIIVFNSSLRMTVASLIAFIISQYHDIITFNFLKEKTHGKFLWLRNNVSTIISQFIDTTIFMFMAFYMITPKFTAGYVFALIIPYWTLKIIASLIDTPFVYMGVRWLKK